jgi:hypothetical protein
MFSPRGPDDDRELGLPVDLFRHALVPDDVVVRSDDGGWWLGEEDRMRGQLEFLAAGLRRFLHMIRVIASKTEHVLGRPRNRCVPAHRVRRMTPGGRRVASTVSQQPPHIRPVLDQIEHVARYAAAVICRARKELRDVGEGCDIDDRVADHDAETSCVVAWKREGRVSHRRHRRP